MWRQPFRARIGHISNLGGSLETFDTHELAWAAGFIDGEGWIGCSGKHAVLQITASQVDRRALDRLVVALHAGRVSGPYKKGSSVTKPIYQFNLCRLEDTQMAIIRLWPWLGPYRRAQAKNSLLRVRNLHLVEGYKPCRRLTEKEKQSIAHAILTSDLSISDIAKQHGVSYNSALRVRNRMAA